MTEQEYIDVKDMTHLQDALDALNNIAPENSKTIDLVEMRHLTRKIKEWRDKLHDKIDIIDER